MKAERTCMLPSLEGKERRHWPKKQRDSQCGRDQKECNNMQSENGVLSAAGGVTSKRAESISTPHSMSGSPSLQESP